MPASPAESPAPSRRALLPLRPFLWLSAGLLPLCGVFMLGPDQALARFCHFHLQSAEPFFSRFTEAVDRSYDLAGLPVVLLALAAAFALGRWVGRWPGAVAFLITLLTHVASIGTSNVLKGVVRRLRPEVLFSGGYADLGFQYAHAPHSDSFPSTHTATYFSLFVPLALAFPRLRLPMLLIPVLIGLGRLVMGAHYLSDVLFSLWLVGFYIFLFGQLQRVGWLTGPAPAPATA
jgi:membrane-associated phospholipid phosphatase